MSDTLTTPDTPSITRLMSGLMDDAKTLLSQHIAMARAEIRTDIERSVRAVKILGVGSMLMSVGSVFIIVSLVFAIQAVMPGWPIWASWLIVGGLAIVAGSIASVIGMRMLRTVNPIPTQSLAAIQEDVTWLSKPRN